MPEVITNLITLIPALAPYGGYLAAAVGVASAVARFMPPPSMPASGFYPLAYAAVNALAFNSGHATNRSKPGAAP